MIITRRHGSPPCRVYFHVQEGHRWENYDTPTTYRHSDEHGIWISPFVHMPLPWQGQG